MHIFVLYIWKRRVNWVFMVGGKLKPIGPQAAVEVKSIMELSRLGTEVTTAYMAQPFMRRFARHMNPNGSVGGFVEEGINLNPKLFHYRSNVIFSDPSSSAKKLYDGRALSTSMVPAEWYRQSLAQIIRR